MRWRSQRAYATSATSAKESNLAPILLGIGLVGAGGFFYSTSGQRNSLQTESLVDKVKNVVAPTVSALSPDEFRPLKLAKVSVLHPPASPPPSSPRLPASLNRHFDENKLSYDSEWNDIVSMRRWIQS